MYFNCDGRLDDAIGAVEANGGTIIKAKHPIVPHGSRAIVVAAKETGSHCIRVRRRAE